MACLALVGCRHESPAAGSQYSLRIMFDTTDNHTTNTNW